MWTKKARVFQKKIHARQFQRCIGFAEEKQMENLKMPQYVEQLKNRHIALDGCDIVIRARKKGLQEKPPLYMWNLTRACYVSSLKPGTEKDTFTFDIRTQEKNLLLYKMHLQNDKISVEQLV